MRCDSCDERDAEIHLTQIVEGELESVHLCESCAEEQGVSGSSKLGGGAPLADFLAEMGKSGAESAPPAPSEDCPYCGTSGSDFRRTGRLGCAQCYVHFEDQLRPLLRRIHGATHHVGKLYLNETTVAEDPRTRLEHLKSQLQRAVELEDFETAAELRDRIHEMEPVDG